MGETIDGDVMPEIKGIKSAVLRLLEMGEYEQLQEFAEEICELQIQDDILNEVIVYMQIYGLESESVNGLHSEWFDFRSWEKRHRYYAWLCETCRKFATGIQDDSVTELRARIKDGRISHDALREVLSSVCTKNKNGEQTERLWDMHERPLVSVVIAVHNGAEFVNETIESVMQQTYEHIEIIIVDDASTDGSREVINAYAAEDNRIKPVFLEKNRHVCYAGNVGFEHAAGKYIALIGHDDLWRKDKLEKQVDFLEEHPAYSACFSWVDIVDEAGCLQNEKWNILQERFCTENRSQASWNRKMLLDRNHFCAPSACIRADVLRRTGFYRYALVQLQDYDLWLRILREGPVYIYQEKLTLYRRFNEEGKNLSYMDAGTENRAWHENQWIQDDYIEHLSENMFFSIFHRELLNPDAKGQKELRCEKAFLLWRLQNCFAEKRLIELLEDCDCRKILEEKYHFTLLDFYKMNMQPMHFDISRGD